MLTGIVQPSRDYQIKLRRQLGHDFELRYRNTGDGTLSVTETHTEGMDNGLNH